MSIHNTHFFLDPVNYQPGRVMRQGTTVIVNEMTDNSYRTFSTEQDIAVNIADRLGNPTAVTHLFLKYQGDLTSYVATPTGGTGAPFTRTVPTEVTNWEGNTVSLEVDEYKHDLFEVPSGVTGTSLRLQFTGTEVRIFNLFVLESGLEINANGGFSRIHPVEVDRTGVIHQNTDGGLYYDDPIGATRNKWEYDLVLLSTAATEFPYKDLLRWISAYPNCAFAREFTRKPDEVMLVTFPQLEKRIQPRSNLYKGAGDRVPFRVAER